MKIFKSHFWYTKSQRNGILFLVTFILTFQAIYFFIDFSSEDTIDISSPKIIMLQKQIDSLKHIELEKRKPKIYAFNPNYITDFKGYKLGMSTNEIDRLLTYRKQHKWINSKEDFKRVTKISDSLLNQIAPYFKFPDWVIKQQQSRNQKEVSFKNNNPPKKTKLSTTDINRATAEDFRTISGVGEQLSNRIIKYRSKLHGYSIKEQLYEVWGLHKNVANTILQTFSIKEKPSIQKININTASFKDVLRTPYIDYELCKKIFNYRDEVAELQNINELKNIEGFPLEKFNRIILYLETK